jgi:thiol:disulfide interchange protein DsbD
MSNRFDRRLRAAPYTSLYAFLALVCCLLPLLFGAAPAYADDDFLPPDQAFTFSASEEPGVVDVHFKIADGYYMYRERFAFATRNGTATLGDAQIPPGHVKFDTTFNKNVETYRKELTIRVPVKQASGAFDLAVTSQGCADAGICYPPAEHVYHVSGAALQAATSGQGAPSSTAGNGAQTETLFDGRTAVEPRRETARADAARDRPAAARAGRDDHLCHPRPDRGDDHGRPHCRDARRRAAAD